MKQNNTIQNLKSFYNNLVAAGELTAKQAKRKFNKKVRAISTDTPVAYFGGKSKLASFLMSLMPADKSKYKTYIECFSGAFGLYFKGDMSEFEEIIYNDFNFHMTNFVSCFQRDQQFKARLLDYMNGDLYFDTSLTYEERKEYFRLVYDTWIDELKGLTKEEVGLYNIEVAVKFGFLINHTFNNCNPFSNAGFVYQESKSNTTKFHRILEKLNDDVFITKAKCITHFYSLDFEELMNRYNREDVYLLSDAPYYNFEGQYDSEDCFGTYGHIRLAKASLRFKGALMLTYYDFPALKWFYPNTYYNWFNYLFKTTAGTKKGETGRGNEIIITNY